MARPYETIPSTTLPGLRFLKSFLPAVVTLDPTIHPLSPFFTSNAPNLICSNPPSTASTTIPLLEVRSRHLSHPQDQVHIAWDTDLSQRDSASTALANITENNPEHGTSDKMTLYALLPGPMRLNRTVMFEATSSAVFKNDPDEFVVKVREFNIFLGLEGKEQDDLQVVEMRIFMDRKPVQARAQQLNAGIAFGEGAREAEPS
ncbi:hypothetical protein N7481_007115 [Penicillium waksmanii]|uniref:uncharacterized protein n=1 Tax=Penicillium waksmanii TaxID=69791 RepID=UPI002547B5EB|nr:uncharacterized protein N7481_007115 [Penicillium waksmanii]KAJ5979817.1 hypothetical protein N7481_007115 [Penicillium waksmanii]